MAEPTKEDRELLDLIACDCVRTADWHNTGERSKTEAAQRIADYREASYAKGVEEGRKAALKEVIRPIEECNEDYAYTFINAKWMYLDAPYLISTKGQLHHASYFAILPVPESVWGETI